MAPLLCAPGCSGVFETQEEQLVNSAIEKYDPTAPTARLITSGGWRGYPQEILPAGVPTFGVPLNSARREATTPSRRYANKGGTVCV
jgi:hypothetical protein